MKKKLCLAALLVTLALVATGCNQASRVSYNLSQEADNFNDIRQITVMNCIQGDVLFQMTGKMSITADVEDNQLEVIVEDENGEYKKHFIGLSDNVTYVVEDVTTNDVDQYQYTMNGEIIKQQKEDFLYTKKFFWYTCTSRYVFENSTVW